MSFATRLRIQSNPPIRVTATSVQSVLATFDYTALPGLGRALVPPFVIKADVCILMTSSGAIDHSARMWDNTVVWEYRNATLGWHINSPVASRNGQPNGLIGASTAAAPTYDVSGTLGRVLAVPVASASISWYVTMDLQILEE